MPADDPEVTIRALADPHRRALLDALREADGRPVRELESVLPELGRHAVLKHLRVLADAELVTTRKVGRSRYVQLNPVPIVDLARRWLDDYAAVAGLALSRLRDHVESDLANQGATMPDTTVPDTTVPNTTVPNAASTTAEPPTNVSNANEPTTRTLVATVVISAPPQQVWAAMTDPEQTRRWFFGGLVRSDWSVGAPIEWLDADGASLIAGEITAIEPEVRLAHTFRATWSAETAADPASHYEWALQQLQPDVTRVTVTHTDVPVGTPTEQQVDGGTSLVISSLKTFVETGRTMPGMG